MGSQRVQAIEQGDDVLLVRESDGRSAYSKAPDARDRFFQVFYRKGRIDKIQAERPET